MFCCTYCDWFQVANAEDEFCGWMMDLHHVLVHPREWYLSFKRDGIEANAETFMEFYLEQLRLYTPDPRENIIHFATHRPGDDEPDVLMDVYDPMPK